MAFGVLRDEDLDAAADFISKMNNVSLTHVGWLSKEAEVIRKQIVDLPNDYKNSFVVHKSSKGIDALLGWYLSKEQKVARLLGPYVESGNREGVANDMYLRFIELIPEWVERVIIAPNTENKLVSEFAKKNGFTKYNSEMKMEFPRNGTEFPNTKGKYEVVPYDAKYESGFRALHPEGVYFTASEILERLNQENVVMIALDGKSVVGYIYLENEGESVYLHFINVAKDMQGKGIGSALINAAKKWSFSNTRVMSMNLSVRPENEAADIFRKAGFKKVLQIDAYDKNLSFKTESLK